MHASIKGPAFTHTHTNSKNINVNISTKSKEDEATTGSSPHLCIIGGIYSNTERWRLLDKVQGITQEDYGREKILHGC